MSFLTRYTHSSLLSTFSNSARCLRQRSDIGLLPSRVILVRNFPPKSTVADFLALKGTSHPIESIITTGLRKNTVEICYLEAASAKCTWYNGRNNLMLDGQPLSIRFQPPRRLPVEVVAAIGLYGASRGVVFRSFRGLTKKKLEEDMTRRFGKLERIWVQQEQDFGIVTFLQLQDAIKAKKTLQDEGWLVNFWESLLPQPTKTIRRADPELARHGVLLEGLRDPTPRSVLRHLNDILHFRNGDPIRIDAKDKGAILIFNSPLNAKRICEFYKPPPGVHMELIDTNPPSRRECAAVQVGASRTVVIEGYKKSAQITFDRVHEDFSKFGEIFYVYINPAKAHARVVFTNLASSLKAIEHIHENCQEYEIYHGAHITYARLLNEKEKISPLRPIVIRPALSDKSSSHLIKSAPSTKDFERTSNPRNALMDPDAEVEFDHWHFIDCSPDLGEVDWVEHRDEATGRTRLDVSPRRKEQ
ncbi:hypothetical protein D9758_009214 [Tetrapyrgos nigripes]|uniref:RRM domain-containing protein n=1 Tax=Tetrapyrgos nigripes TaxID=182062 RepID=A0A8H5D4J0_9AGAR|nr:hypothetical protein D9758_009214 [Tetrapyrgos nigripes]